MLLNVVVVAFIFNFKFHKKKTNFFNFPISDSQVVEETYTDSKTEADDEISEALKT